VAKGGLFVSWSWSVRASVFPSASPHCFVDATKVLIVRDHGFEATWWHWCAENKPYACVQLALRSEMLQKLGRHGIAENILFCRRLRIHFAASCGDGGGHNATSFGPTANARPRGKQSPVPTWATEPCAQYLSHSLNAATHDQKKKTDLSRAWPAFNGGGKDADSTPLQTLWAPPAPQHEHVSTPPHIVGVGVSRAALAIEKLPKWAECRKRKAPTIMSPRSPRSSSSPAMVKRGLLWDERVQRVRRNCRVKHTRNDVKLCFCAETFESAEAGRNLDGREATPTQTVSPLLGCLLYCELPPAHSTPGAKSTNRMATLDMHFT
jgi:hypothetical protein